MQDCGSGGESPLLLPPLFASTLLLLLSLVLALLLLLPPPMMFEIAAASAAVKFGSVAIAALTVSTMSRGTCGPDKLGNNNCW